MSNIKQGTLERLKDAMQSAPRSFCTRETLDTHEGASTEAWEVMGLTKQDLKRLERVGIAIRARKPTKEGHVLRWLVMKGELA